MVFRSFWDNFFGSERSNEVCKEGYYKTSSLFVCFFLPVAGLTLIWIRRELLTRILIHIDGICLPIIYPTFSRSRCVLEWARGRLPQQWSSRLETLAGGIADFWRDGSLLCTLINSAIPGACANPYRHWKKPPIHGQNLAYKYLGIIPVFTQSDFSSHLSPYLEAKLLNYIYLIRKAIYIMEKERLIYNLISPKFVARGMGLYTADQYKKTEFYVYSKYDNVSFFNIEVTILGPYSSYCRTTVLEYLIKKSKNKNASSGSINIEIEMDKERIRVAYITKNCGIHEINLSCNRESVMGSPFYVNVIKCPTSNLKTSAVQTVHNKKETKMDYEKPEEISNTSSITVNNKTPRNHIGDSQTLEISKYLKDLSNSREKKVNIHASLLANRDKIWANCPDYFTRENYLYFQKLVDSSFRKTCRVTRAHPKFSQKMFPQFSSASPICSDHIVPEGCRKLTADDQKKVLPFDKTSSVDGTFKNSSFSVDENENEFKSASDLKGTVNHKPLIVGELLFNSKEQKKFTNENHVKRLQGDTKKRSLQKVIQEKALFWESVFKQATAESSNSFVENYGLINESILHNNNQNIEKNTKLKHVDSLCLLRNRPPAKSLSGLCKIDMKKVQLYRSIDENLVSCCKISLEDRIKLYLENAQQINEELVSGNRRKSRAKYKIYNSRNKSKQFFKKRAQCNLSGNWQESLKSQNSSQISMDILDIDLRIRNMHCLDRRVKNNVIWSNVPHSLPNPENINKFMQHISYFPKRSYNTNRNTKKRMLSINKFDVLY